jgi:hypothetical protein
MTDLNKLVKPLVWHQSGGTHIMDGESHTVPTGYSVRYADENGWKWSTPLGAYGWECNPSLAKAAAQADYTARIFAALDPEALARRRDEAAQAEREACAVMFDEIAKDEDALSDNYRGGSNPWLRHINAAKRYRANAAAIRARKETQA